MSSIRVLTKLQDVDTEIHNRRTRLDEIRTQLEDTDALLALQEEVAGLRVTLATLELKQRSDEREVEDARLEVQESEQNLYGGTVRNPKELVNLEQELTGMKTRLKGQEDLLLTFLTEVEEQRNELQHASDQLEAEESRRLALETDLGAARQSLETELDQLTNHRKTLTDQVPSRDLALYESLLISKTGRAIAKIERANCQGCRINLPVTVQLRVRADQTLIQCPSCSRILYM